MSKGRKESPSQMGLFGDFEEEPSPGSLNCEFEIRAEMVRAIKQSRLSREEIAERMSELIGRTISKEMLDAWTAESKRLHRPPAEFLPAFCVATGSDGPIRVQARKIKGDLADSDTTTLAGIGKAYLQEEEAKVRKVELMRRVRR